jgi:prepilin-type processing-associated H-X9-DG protein
MFTHAARRGKISLVDVIGVSVIVFLLFLVIFPALRTIREEAANPAGCWNNLRQIGIAFNNHDAQKGYMPRPAGTNQSGGTSILWQLGPYLEADVGPGPIVATTGFKIFHCPSDRSYVPGNGGTSYGVNVRGMNGSDGHGGAVTDVDTYATLREDSEARDSSNLVLAGDIGQAGKYLWASPVGAAESAEGSYNGFLGRQLPDTSTATGPGSDVADAPLFSSFHKGGKVNLALADGHAVSASNASKIAAGCLPSVRNADGDWSTAVDSSQVVVSVAILAILVLATFGIIRRLPAGTNAGERTSP